MKDLNQYAISKSLGSTMRPIKRGRFGNFGLLETVAEALRAETASEAESVMGQDLRYSYDEDALVVQAFEDVRNGVGTDALLWDSDLARAFHHRCRELGLKAPGSYLSRRLITVRKNIRRYEQHGIKIAPATVKKPHISIVPKYAHVIEFALVKLRYRYGASIDDILLDTILGEKFETQAQSLAPGVSNMDLRLGALYIRKCRNFKKKDREKLEALDVSVIDRALSKPLSLPKVRPSDVPVSAGLLEIAERGRYLYISGNDSLRPAVEQFRTGKAFELVANGFWTPKLDDITVQVVAGEKVDGAGISLWERRLIHDREPVFNWPVLGVDDEEAA